MEGSARVWKEVWLPAPALGLAAGASSYGTTGSPLVSLGAGASGGRFYIPTLSPSSTTCDMQFDATWVAPPDMDTAAAASPYCIVEHVLTAAFDTASNIGYRINYNWVTTGCTTTSGSFISSNIGVSAACNAGARVSGSLPLMPPAASRGQFMHVHFRMLTGACSSGSLADVAGVRFKYLANRLGDPTS